MIISTRGRYALRVMVNLARHDQNTFTPLKEMAEQEDISLKYMESIMTSLSKAGLVDGAHGKGGGYRLAKAPEDYTVGEILRVTETSLSATACVENGNCPKIGHCATYPVWQKLDRLINGFLDGISLSELMTSEPGNDYII